MTLRLSHTPRRLLNAAVSWPVSSQQQSRRNALVASTALMQRRRELDDVEDFLATLAAHARSSVAPAQRTRHTA